MKRTISMLLLICTVFAACTGQDAVPTESNQVVFAPQKQAPLTDDTALISYESLWSQADAVFIGEVNYISATMTETGSNEMFHQVAFSVVDTAFDYAGIGSGVVMTVQGQSPVDDILVVRGGEQLMGTAVHDLQVGDQTVVFARIENLNNNQIGNSALVPVAASGQLFIGIEHWTNVQTFASLTTNMQ